MTRPRPYLTARNEYDFEPKGRHLHRLPTAVRINPSPGGSPGE